MSDLIERQAAIDAPERHIKDCNPEHFVGHQKFIEYMDNAEIGSFGSWQFANGFNTGLTAAEVEIKQLQSAQPEHLTDDDFETIRIHLNAYKEKLCNQRRWKEAEEYQRIIDRFMSFASEQPERKKGEWKEVYAETDYRNGWIEFSCECCEYQHGLESGEYGWHYGDEIPWKYCPLCGADMRGEEK